MEIMKKIKLLHLQFLGGITISHKQAEGCSKS